MIIFGSSSFHYCFLRIDYAITFHDMLMRFIGIKLVDLVYSGFLPSGRLSVLVTKGSR